MFDVTTRHAGTACPSCAKVLDASAGGGTPEAGDVTVCGYCGTPLCFDLALRLRPLTTQELEQLEPELQDQLVQIAQVVAVLNAKKAHPST